MRYFLRRWRFRVLPASLFRPSPIYYSVLASGQQHDLSNSGSARSWPHPSFPSFGHIQQLLVGIRNRFLGMECCEFARILLLCSFPPSLSTQNLPALGVRRTRRVLGPLTGLSRNRQSR